MRTSPPSRLDGEQVAIRTRHAQHVSKGAEDHIRALRDGVGLVDHLERRHADGTSRTMHKLDAFRQKMVDAVFDDGMGLAAADLHQHPRPRLNAANLLYDTGGNWTVPVFIEIFHRSSSPLDRED